MHIGLDRRQFLVGSASAAQNTEGFVDGSGNTVQDDFLLNTADR